MNTNKIPQGPKIIEIPKNETLIYAEIEFLLEKFPSFILDLGVGTWDSSLMLCQKHPESLIIALERTAQKFSQFKSKIQNHNPTNLLAIHGDYNKILPEIWNRLESSVISVFWFYPNPCLKYKNKHFRFYNQDAFQLVSKNKNILLEIRTDQEKQLFQIATLLKRKNLIEMVNITNGIFYSAFEKKYFNQKRNLYRLVATPEG